MKEQETNEQDGSTVPCESLRRAPSELASIWAWQQTARLTLRRLLPTAGPAMFVVHGDPATSEEMLRALLQSWDTSDFGYWTVLLARGAEENIIGFGGRRTSGLARAGSAERVLPIDPWCLGTGVRDRTGTEGSVPGPNLPTSVARRCAHASTQSPLYPYCGTSGVDPALRSGCGTGGLRPGLVASHLSEKARDLLPLKRRKSSEMGTVEPESHRIIEKIIQVGGVCGTRAPTSHRYRE